MRGCLYMPVYVVQLRNTDIEQCTNSKLTRVATSAALDQVHGAPTTDTIPETERASTRQSLRSLKTKIVGPPVLFTKCWSPPCATSDGVSWLLAKSFVSRRNHLAHSLCAVLEDSIPLIARDNAENAAIYAGNSRSSCHTLWWMSSVRTL